MTRGRLQQGSLGSAQKGPVVHYWSDTSRQNTGAAVVAREYGLARWLAAGLV